MDDLISRQAAIDAFLRATADGDKFEWCEYVLKGVPSVQPQRMSGKWIKLYEGNYKCSECGDWWGNDDNDMVENFHYCPNCGADMRG